MADLIADREGAAVITCEPETIPRRAEWHAVLATWSFPQRQRWGELANRYEDDGLKWIDAEWKAFGEVSATRMERGSDVT